MASQNHVLVIPFPVQGHINPMIQFSKHLASKGLKVTLVATSTISKSIQAKTSSSITIQSISDGLQEGDIVTPDAYFNRFKNVVSKNLIELIERQKSTYGHPFKVLVYDSLVPWALELAHGMGLKGASFFTQSCGVSVLYYHMHEGTLRIPEDGAMVSVDSMSIELKVNDLPSFIYDFDSNPALARNVINQFSNIWDVDWVLFNTFDKLEDEVAKWMASKWSIKTIGPTIPSGYLDKPLTNDKDYGLNLFNSNQDIYKKWLDRKENGSVVYVSFGSIANIKEEQMEEVACSLMSSKFNFLWVVRASEECKLHKDFLSNTLERGLVVHWCSQLEVLAHKAVGCFMTHCGWNSTLEAISLGVPTVAMPQWTDQTTNAKFIVDVWRTGIRVKVDEKGVATREEIEACVKEVMEGGKGEVLKRNALKLKEFAREAVRDGGSSDKNIDEFISSFCSPSIDVCSKKS